MTLDRIELATVVAAGLIAVGATVNAQDAQDAQALRPGLETIARVRAIPEARAGRPGALPVQLRSDRPERRRVRRNYSALYVDARGEHVIFDVKGPGSVYTLWFTSRESGFAPLGWGRIRFYFDDETEPRLDLDATSCSAAGGGRSSHRSSSTGSPARAATSATCRCPSSAA